MTSVVFNPDQPDSGDNFRRSSSQGLAGWLVRVSGGIIKSESMANLVLVLVAIICFAASIAILVLTF